MTVTVRCEVGDIVEVMGVYLARFTDNPLLIEQAINFWICTQLAECCLLNFEPRALIASTHVKTLAGKFTSCNVSGMFLSELYNRASVIPRELADHTATIEIKYRTLHIYLDGV